MCYCRSVRAGAASDRPSYNVESLQKPGPAEAAEQALEEQSLEDRKAALLAATIGLDRGLKSTVRVAGRFCTESPPLICCMGTLCRSWKGVSYPPGTNPGHLMLLHQKRDHVRTGK